MSITLVRPVSRKSTTAAHTVDSFSHEEFEKSLKFIKLGIYPFMVKHGYIDSLRIENLIKGAEPYLPLIYPEVLEKYFNEHHDELQKVIAQNSFFSNSEPQDHNLLIDVISDTFYSRLGYRPRNPFNVDNSMFIFRGGFLSAKWGACGDYEKFVYLFHRWNTNNWSPYPLIYNERIKSIIDRTIESVIDIFKYKRNLLYDVLEQNFNEENVNYYVDREKAILPNNQKITYVWFNVYNNQSAGYQSYNITSILLYFMKKPYFILHKYRNFSYDKIKIYLRPTITVSECPLFGSSLLEKIRTELTKMKDEESRKIREQFKLKAATIKPFIPTPPPEQNKPVETSSVPVVVRPMPVVVPPVIVRPVAPRPMINYIPMVLMYR